MAESDVDMTRALWSKAFQVKDHDANTPGRTFEMSIGELRVRVEEVACQAMATETRLVKDVQELRRLFESQPPASLNVDVQAIARTAAATAAYTASHEFRQSLTPKSSPSRNPGESRDLLIQFRKLAQDVAREERGRTEEMVSSLKERVANLEAILDGHLGRTSGENEKPVAPPGAFRQYSFEREKEISNGSVLVATRSAPQGQRDSHSPGVARMLSSSVVVTSRHPTPVVRSQSRGAAAAVAEVGACAGAPPYPGSPPAQFHGSRSPTPVLAGGGSPYGGGAPRTLRSCASARSTLPARITRCGSPVPAGAFGCAVRGPGSPSPPPVGSAVASAHTPGHPFAARLAAVPCSAGEPGIARPCGQSSPSPSIQTSASASTQSQATSSTVGAAWPDCRLPTAAPLGLPTSLASLPTGSASVPLLPGTTLLASGGTAMAGGEQATGSGLVQASELVQAALSEGLSHLSAALAESQRTGGGLPRRA